jgi:endo-1,4-beta-xylanase
LTYNEYGIEGEDEASEKKRVAVLILLRRLTARRVPLDAVGIQSHITAGHTYGAGLAAFIAAARGLGLQVFLTEMDGNDREWPADDAVRDAAVAEAYGAYLDLALRDPAVRADLGDHRSRDLAELRRRAAGQAARALSSVRPRG